MVELPPELWLRILQYTDPESTSAQSKLYAVNRVFYDHIMGLKYAELDVSIYPRSLKWHNDPLVRLPLRVVVALRDESNRGRVRSVAISNRGYPWWKSQQEKRDIELYGDTISTPSEPSRGLLGRLTGMFNAKADSKSIYAHASKESVQQLLALPHLTTLKIELWIDKHDPPSSLPKQILFNAALTLTTLYMKFQNPADFSFVFQDHHNTDSTSFPSIHHLRLEFGAEWFEDSTPPLGILSTLANNIPKVKILELFLAFPIDNPTPTLAFLVPLQKPGLFDLEEMRVVGNFSRAGQRFGLVSAMLGNPSMSLRVLDLVPLEEASYMETRREGATLAPGHVAPTGEEVSWHIPELYESWGLVHLRIPAPHTAAGLEGLCQMVHHSSETLQSLRIFACDGVCGQSWTSSCTGFDGADVQTLLGLLQGCPRLQQLDICVRYLTVTLLKDVQTQCPSVQELCIRWWQPGSSDTMSSSVIDDTFRHTLFPHAHHARGYWRTLSFSTSDRYALAPVHHMRTAMQDTHWRTSAPLDVHRWDKQELDFVPGAIQLDADVREGEFSRFKEQWYRYRADMQHDDL